jgi:putative transposase
MNMLTELRNRSIASVCIVCCDGLTGLADTIGAIWSPATVHTRVVHRVRNSLRYASKKYCPKITGQLRDVCTAPTLAAAETRFTEFAAQWRSLYPAMIQMRENAGGELTPFLNSPPEIRQLIYTTNGIESLNAKSRQATRRRGHFANEQAAMKMLYLACLERRPNRTNPIGQIAGWKGILNTPPMTYGDRLAQLSRSPRTQRNEQTREWSGLRVAVGGRSGFRVAVVSEAGQRAACSGSRSAMPIRR